MVTRSNNYSGNFVKRNEKYTAVILLLVELIGHVTLTPVFHSVNEHNDILFADDNLQNRRELETK